MGIVCRQSEAPAELSSAANMPTIACEPLAAADEGSAEVSPSRDFQAFVQQMFRELVSLLPGYSLRREALVFTG